MTDAVLVLNVGFIDAKVIGIHGGNKIAGGIFCAEGEIVQIGPEASSKITHDGRDKSVAKL